MDNGLSIALTFLAYTCIILFTLTTGFLLVLIKDIMDLSKSYKKLCDTVQKEVQPTLEEIKKALVGINGLATGVDKQINVVKDSFGVAYDAAYKFTSKFKGASLALMGGLLAGLKFFLKKKR